MKRWRIGSHISQEEMKEGRKDEMDGKNIERMEGRKESMKEGMNDVKEGRKEAQEVWQGRRKNEKENLNWQSHLLHSSLHQISIISYYTVPPFFSIDGFPPSSCFLVILLPATLLSLLLHSPFPFLFVYFLFSPSPIFFSICSLTFHGWKAFYKSQSVFMAKRSDLHREGKARTETLMWNQCM